MCVWLGLELNSAGHRPSRNEVAYPWCIVKTNSRLLSSHEDVNTFQFQQATIFTATLLFQPQLITTMYIQLQMIKHINRQFVVLQTCTRT